MGGMRNCQSFELSIKLPFKKRSNKKTVFFLHLAEINDLNHFSK
jgi:hypothetical protein